MSEGGTYTIVVELSAPASITVGALGNHEFPPGGYAYTGSAFGTGGFARIDRHRELAAGERDTRHWHVDYLLTHPAVEVVDVVTTAGTDIECEVAERLDPGPVDGFGASDCDCSSHLARESSPDALVERVRRVHRSAV